MNPSSLMDHCLNSRVTDAELTRDGSQRQMAARISSNPFDFVGIEFCTSYLFTAQIMMRELMPPFGNSIQNIAVIGSNEQMARITTEPIIAFVADTQSDRNGPIR